MGDVIRFVSKYERERERLIREARARYDSIFPPADPVSEQRDKAQPHMVNGANAHGRKWTSCHDQNHRRALQSLLFSKLPRADRHHLRLRRRLAEVLPNGRAAARRVDEATPAERLAAWRCVIGKQDGTAA